MAKKKKKEASGPSGDWIVTYSDMVTLMLCFFVALFNPEDVDPSQLAALISAFANRGMGANVGGNTISQGKAADLGNTVMTLPSMDKGRAMGPAMRKAVSMYTPEVKSNKVKITQDERGIIISLASDIFFNPASARLNIEESRDMLFRLQSILNSDDVRERKIRIEGHTDSEGVDPNGPWEDNWDLSTARSRAVLHFLTDIGVNEKRFQVAGFADTVPVSSNSTVQGREYNRRVDIIILDEAHL
jgi:chemotaxis protein MotB